jgi:hypothetical protein
LDDFLSSARRWLEKATNGSVIKGNLPPFTLTGDYNDAVFPMVLINKAPWWIPSVNLDDFNHSTPELYLQYPRLMIGSWCNYEEAHHYYQKLIDKDIQFREDKQKERLKMTQQEKADRDTTNSDTRHYPHFKTNMKKGTVAWDITENREVLEEYERRQYGEKSRKLKQFSDGWNRLMDESVKLISDIKEGKIDKKSNEIQGIIGNELKTKEEIKKRKELDDPNNGIWKRKQIFQWRPKFIEMKIRNTIQWQEFCDEQPNKK